MSTATALTSSVGFQIGRRGYYGVVYRHEPHGDPETTRVSQVWRCDHHHKGSGLARKCAAAEAARMLAVKA